MGDNGSQAVGFLIAGSAVAVANETSVGASALFVPVVMLPFIFDVSFTLVHRIARRRDVLSAHREHLYQLLSRLGLSHASVTAIYLSLTALSTMAAILMLRLAPAQQWIAPTALISLALAPALFIFQTARRHGLLAADTETELLAAQSSVAVETSDPRFEQITVRAAE